MTILRERLKGMDYDECTHSKGHCAYLFVDEKERKLGGQLGFGLEITPPVLDLGIEGRGTVMFPDLSGDLEEKLLTVTVGINYYF